MRHIIMIAVAAVFCTTACGPLGASPGGGTPTPGSSPPSTVAPTPSARAESATVTATLSPTASQSSPSVAPSSAAPAMPRDEDFLAAAFNPIVGQQCTQGEKVILGKLGEAVRMWASCDWAAAGSDGEVYVNNFQTDPEQPAFFGGRQCDMREVEVGDTWMGAEIHYTCKRLTGTTRPSQEAGIWEANRVSREELDQAKILRLDVYRTALEQPLGEPCPTSGVTLATFDAGTADLAIECQEILAGNSFYRLEITPTSSYGWKGSPGSVADGTSCGSEDRIRVAQTISPGYPARVLYCAELDPANAATPTVWRRVAWPVEPPSYLKMCTTGDPELEEVQGQFRFTLGCRSMHGSYQWAVVWAEKIG